MNQRLVNAYLHKGTILTKMGRNEEALDALNKTLELTPDNEKALLTKGTVLTNLGKHKEATNCFNKVNIEGLEDPTLKIQILKQRAASQRALKLNDEAYSTYYEILELDENDIETWENMYTLLKELNRTDELLNCLEQLLAANPDNMDYLREKARILQAQEDYSGALDLIRAILDKLPEDIELWYSRYTIAKQLGDLTEITIVIDKLLDLEPDNLQMWNDKVVQDLGKTKESLEINKIMLEKFPDTKELWYTRFEIAQELKNIKEMVNVIDNILNFEPDQAQTWHDKVLQAAAKPKTKLQINKTILKKLPENRELWYARYTLVKDQQDIDEMVIVLDNILALEPDKLQFWQDKILLDLGKTDATLELNKNMLAKYPDSKVLWYARYEISNELQDIDEIANVISNILDLEPEQLQVWQSKVLEDLGKTPQTLEINRMLIEKNPENNELWYTRYELAKELQNIDEMIMVINSLLDLEPDNVQMWLDKILQDLGRTYDTLEIIKNMLKKYPETRAFWDIRYTLQKELNVTDEWMKVINKLLKFEPDNLELWHEKLSYHEEQGEPEKVLKCCNSLIKIDPEDFSIWNKKIEALKNLKRPSKALETMEDLNKYKQQKYREVLRDAWDDGVLTKKEKKLIGALRKQSGISKDEHEEIEEEIKKELNL